jgi:hypothetical protein
MDGNGQATSVTYPYRGWGTQGEDQNNRKGHDIACGVLINQSQKVPTPY